MTDNVMVPAAIHPPLRYDTAPQWVVFVSALLLVFFLIGCILFSPYLQFNVVILDIVLFSVRFGICIHTAQYNFHI